MLQPPIPTNNTELSQEITRLAGHINAAQHRFVTLLAALIERNAWEGNGIKSPAHWLNYHCGIDLGAAREKVRVAKSLSALPAIDAAFRNGTISYSKVRAMTRSATPQNEQLLLQVALHGTAHHVEQLVRKHRRAERLSARAQDQHQYAARQLTSYFDDDGMLVLHARLTPEEGAAFMKALEITVGAMNPPTAKTEVELPTSEEEKTFPQKRADALVAMAEHAVSTMKVDGPQLLASAQKYEVIIHIEREQFADTIPVSHSESAETRVHHSCSIETTHDHFPISSATARRLCCDAGMVTVLKDSSGDVLDVGRRTRTIPPAIRRALHLRDHGCRFPGCCESRYVDAHHVRHWCDGGETRLDNLVLLCRHHHRLLHHEGYNIARTNKGDFEFVTPNGRTMARTVVPQFSYADEYLEETFAIEREHMANGIVIDPHTAVTRWEGERMDYQAAVGFLLRESGGLTRTSSAPTGL